MVEKEVEVPGEGEVSRERGGNSTHRQERRSAEVFLLLPTPQASGTSFSVKTRPWGASEDTKKERKRERETDYDALHSNVAHVFFFLPFVCLIQQTIVSCLRVSVVPSDMGLNECRPVSLSRFFLFPSCSSCCPPFRFTAPSIVRCCGPFPSFDTTRTL